MIVVAIIGILAAIAIPKFAALIRKSSEGASKGNLGALRSAMSIYYGDMEGQYPSVLDSLTIAGKYMSAVPNAKEPNYHADASFVYYGAFHTATDAGGSTDAMTGSVFSSTGACTGSTFTTAGSGAGAAAGGGVLRAVLAAI